MSAADDDHDEFRDWAGASVKRGNKKAGEKEFLTWGILKAFARRTMCDLSRKRYSVPQNKGMSLKERSTLDHVT